MRILITFIHLSPRFVNFRVQFQLLHIILVIIQKHVRIEIEIRNKSDKNWGSVNLS